MEKKRSEVGTFQRTAVRCAAALLATHCIHARPVYDGTAPPTEPDTTLLGEAFHAGTGTASTTTTPPQADAADEAARGDGTLGSSGHFRSEQWGFASSATESGHDSASRRAAAAQRPRAERTRPSSERVTRSRNSDARHWFARLKRQGRLAELGSFLALMGAAVAVVLIRVAQTNRRRWNS